MGAKKHKDAEIDDRGYLLHMRDLKLAYRQTYWQLRRALKEAEKVRKDDDGKLIEHPDVQTIKGMISDVSFSILWLHTGKQPGNRRGIERRSAYQREKLMDPLLMQSYMAQSNAGSPANITDDERYRLEMALCTVSGRERECYELAHGQGFSFGCIANMLGISKGAVEEYVNRAQRKISDELARNIFLNVLER